jgi:glycosyltransferase involved in cell wall biosynthesis
MKILFIVKERKYKGFGGVETLMKNLSKEFNKKGHSVDILSRQDDLGLNSVLQSLFPLREKIKEIMKKEKYDIIYTQDWNIALPLLFPYPIFRKKHFCFFNATQSGKGFFIQVPVGILMGRRLLTGDRGNKKRYSKSTLLATAVNMDEFKPLNKKRIYLGWTNKPTEVLNKGKINEIGKNLGIPVLIAEDIPHEKMNEFYNKCKIYISLPPKGAGGGVTYLEIMAAGVPRIVGNMYSEGYKFPFDKIESFSSLEEAIKNSKERNYRKWMEESGITWEKHAENLIKIFTGK